MASSPFRIDTPHGSIIKYINDSGGVTAELEWKDGFGPMATAAFGKAQQFVDSEVLRCTAPYMPKQTGMLIQSGALGTVVGSGEVRYIAPYAAAQLHTRPTRSYDSKRGGNFFERMKIDHKDSIVRGAKKQMGG